VCKEAYLLAFPPVEEDDKKKKVVAGGAKKDAAKGEERPVNPELKALGEKIGAFLAPQSAAYSASLLSDELLIDAIKVRLREHFGIGRRDE
jgi:hypothetical protein